MNESPLKMGRYAVIGIVLLCLLITLGWFAFRQEPPPPDQQPAKVETVKPVAPAFEPTDDSSSETPTNQPNDSATTNAADLYRQAFALYSALTNDEKGILRDWRTNIDASVEAELCEKIRPICDLMHQASTVTNCDWGFDPVTTDALLPYLGPARNIARTAIWSAAHCRSNDVTGATDDAVAVLRLGQKVSQGAMLGCLVDMALQGLASSYVAENLERFQGADAQRLATAFDDPSYQDTPSRALEQEAARVDREAEELASLHPDQAGKEVSGFVSALGGNPDTPAILNPLAAFQQVAGSIRGLAAALASSSENGYEAWQQQATELQESNPLAKLMLVADEKFVDHVEGAEVNRSLVVAGLAVAENGTGALQSNPDPSSGQPFVYTETTDGFQLQSTYQMNGKPMTMQFK